MDELKPCPFCGGEAKMRTSISSSIPKRSIVFCYCEKCGASGKLIEDSKCDGTFIKEAIEAWNRRVEQNG